MPTRLLGLALVAGLLAACTGNTPGRESGTAELVTATAVVDAVDRDTREVTLTDPASGESITVVAGDAVRNFDQIQPGDVVQFDYYESVTLSMAEAAGPPTTEIVAGRAPEGALPAGVVAATTTMVVQVISYDPNSASATFLTPDGQRHVAVVPPSLRTFAAARQRGDLVTVTLTEAVAVGITETS